MNLILTGLTITAFTICAPGKNTVKENHEVNKPTNGQASQTIIFKKVFICISLKKFRAK